MTGMLAARAYEIQGRKRRLDARSGITNGCTCTARALRCNLIEVAMRMLLRLVELRLGVLGCRIEWSHGLHIDVTRIAGATTRGQIPRRVLLGLASARYLPPRLQLFLQFALP